MGNYRPKLKSAVALLREAAKEIAAKDRFKARILRDLANSLERNFDLRKHPGTFSIELSRKTGLSGEGLTSFTFRALADERSRPNSRN